MSSTNITDITRDYYDSADADNFYAQVWGGEDIHIGIYEETDDIAEAGRRIVKFMASMLDPQPGTKILDIGAGYGGAARSIVSSFDCFVTCLNLSQKENERNIAKNKAAGLSEKIEVVEGNFEDLPFADQSFDAVWSEDAILHSGNKKQVLKEVCRVLKPGGRFIFTDPMQADGTSPDLLQPVLARIHLDSMGSFGLYESLADEARLERVAIHDLSENLIKHYSRVKAVMKNENDAGKLTGVSPEYYERMQQGLQHWIDAGKNGYLTWGVMHFRKP